MDGHRCVTTEEGRVEEGRASRFLSNAFMIRADTTRLYQWSSSDTAAKEILILCPNREIE